MEYYLDDYFPSSPLPSYSTSLRDLPPVPTFRSVTRTSRRRSTVPGESSNDRVHIHVAHLKNTDSSPGGIASDDNWATLKVQSKSSKVPLRIIQSQVIQGSLEINLPTKAKSIESISAEVHGEISVIGDSTTRFLFLEDLLWRSVPGHSTLSGRHSLPFNFYLPDRISIPKYASQEVDLPFSVGDPFSVSYKLVIKINRGRFKSNGSIEMPFLYLPFSRAQSPSRQRRLAYRETRVPPGPNLDPEGWFSLGRFTQKGYIFGARIVNIVFDSFLASPLSYAKGTVIPFVILAASDDEQALDLISSRKTLSVSLERKIQMNINTRVKTKGGSAVKTTSIVGIGSFCPQEVNRSTTGWRMIEGEIHIPSNETPSFQTSFLTCSYTVNVELNATGFTPFFKKTSNGFTDSTSPNHSLLLFSQGVTITTYQSSGPRPVFRTEPIYPTARHQDCEELILSRGFGPVIV